MPVNGYTVGRDVTITVTGPGNTSIVIPAAQVTQFEAKPLKREDWARPLNSPPKPLYIPDGWRGTVEVERQDASLDSFQANFEANFWNGQNMLPGSVLQTITEDDGSVTQWQFPQAMFWVEEPGVYKEPGPIKQRLEFCAGIRTRVS